MELVKVLLNLTVLMETMAAEALFVLLAKMVII